MSISPRSRRSWPLFLALGLVVALVAAWTGLWFYLAAQAKAEFATWRERERQAGRQQDCTSFPSAGIRCRSRCIVLMPVSRLRARRC